MRIASAHIEGFGHFHSHDLADLPAGLVVLHGPNEAGKSTLLAFVQYVLFGHERGKKPQRLTGGRVGGRLVLRDGDRVVEIERLEGAPPVLREAGRVEEGDEAVRQRLGGVDRALFRAICGFSLGDLDGLQGLGDEALRDRLFSGALLGAGRSVAQARKALAERRARLWRPRTSSEIRDLARALDAARAELARAREHALGLAALRREADAAADAVDDARTAAGSARREAGRAGALARAWPHHAAWAEASAQLAGLPSVRVDPGARSAFDAARLALAQARATREGEAARHAEALAALDHVAPPDPVLAAEAAVAALVALRDGPAPEAPEAPAELDAARRRLSAALDAAGLRDLDAVRLGPAEVGVLRERARAVEAGIAAVAAHDAAEARRDAERAAAARARLERDAVALDAAAEPWAAESRELARLEPAALDAGARASALDARIAALPSGRPPDPRAVEALHAAVRAWQAATAVADAARGPAGPAVPAGALAALDAGLDAASDAWAASERLAAGAARARDRVRELRAELGEAWTDARIDAWEPASPPAAWPLAAVAAIPALAGLAGLVAAVAAALAGATGAALVATTSGLGLLAVAGALLGSLAWRGRAPAIDPRLPEARDRLREARALGREAHEAAHRWESWCREAAEICDEPIPAPAAARVLLVTLRERARGAAAAGEAERAEGAARACAARLGVPAEVPLAEAHDWLARASLRAALVGDRDAARREHEAWRARCVALRAALGLADDAALTVAVARCTAAEGVRRTWERADEAVRAAEARVALAETALAPLVPAARAAVGARAAWAAALAEHGLPEAVAPAGLELVLDAVARARAARDDAERLAAAIAGAERRAETWFAAAAPAADAAGLPRPTDVAGVRALASALVRRLDAARATERLRLAATEAVRRAAERLAVAESELARASEQVDAVLAASGVASPEALDEAFELAARRAVLSARIDAAALARREALGGAAEDPDTLAALATGELDAWHATAAAAHEALALAEARRDEAVRVHTQRRDQLAALEVSSAIAEAEAKVSVLAERLEVARRRYLDVVLADLLLERTLARFREAHQPAVLRAAAAYLSAATQGRYVGIEPTDDGRDVVVVNASGGRRLSAELSRGTLELLYIVLRLGLAADRANHAPALPLVLDDILVNLDPERAEGLARLLAEVSTRHQVLLLTCRPETRDLLLAHVPRAAALELPRYGGRATPVPSRVPAPVRRPDRPRTAIVAQGRQEVLFQLPES